MTWKKSTHPAVVGEPERLRHNCTFIYYWKSMFKLKHDDFLSLLQKSEVAQRYTAIN